MDPKRWSGREVQKIGPKGTSRWSATLVGKEVRSVSATGTRAPRAAAKAHASAGEAGTALIKALRKKMLDDHVYLRPDAGVGELLFAMALPGGGPADNFDLSVDGETLFVGAGRGDPKAQVLRASLRGGAVERFPVAPDPPYQQLFIHGALLDSSGAAGIFGLNDVVRTLDFGTGTWGQIASVRHRGQEHVNPFCVEPQRDAAHRRLLLVNGDHLEVREWASGQVLLRAPIGTRTAECRRIALSPSGALAAAYVASRRRIYNHDDARGDTTHEVQIWRVADGVQVASVALRDDEDPPDRIALTPDDRALLHDGGRRLTAIDLATEARTPVLTDHDGAIWEWTPGGELAVFDGQALHRRAPPSFAATPDLPLEPQWPQRIRCAPGVAVIGGAGLFCAYRMNW
ncbi:MAG: hypothetical protein R3B09_05935 [Nannocystaceae bacterium]